MGAALNTPRSGHACPNCPGGDPWACHCNPETFEHRPDRVHRPGCPFCEIVDGNAPATILGEWKGGAWGTEILAIVPLNPVVDGHILVLPKTHLVDFTKGGREATQSVWHMHAHLVPRAENDGLPLPWYSGRSRRTSKH